MSVGSRRSKAPAPSLVRRLARENRAMGQRLSQLEYREMQAELASPRLFDLEIDFPGDIRPQAPVLPSVAENPAAYHLAPLNVPLGKIAWVSEPETLPVIGIYCPQTNHEKIQKSLSELLEAHHTRPFARPVFYCASLGPIPFLGRYGFAVEHVNHIDPLAIATRLELRYAAEQLRDLQTGKVLWQRDVSD